MKFRHWEMIAAGLMIYDALEIAFAWFFGLWIRFDFRFTTIPGEYLNAWLAFIPFYIVAAILFFWFTRMYRGVWRFAGFNELLRYAG
ncbi:MAG: polysaccharide biosynthesis protein, partial [Clostridiales bacterium]|nr:polysaccharide biosynthesis protein [Clostridiales bacterium]